MDQFQIEFVVSSRREVSGRSKEGREWKRIEYRGEIVDAFGHVIEADMQSGYDAKESCSCKRGDHLLVNVSELSFRSAYPLLTFSDVAPLTARELKQKA